MVPGVSCRSSVVGVDYRYELRRGDEVVATGHLNYERPLEVGDHVEIGGQPGIVRGKIWRQRRGDVNRSQSAPLVVCDNAFHARQIAWQCLCRWLAVTRRYSPLLTNTVDCLRIS